MKNIGVVVPVYNTSNLLRQCIDSIVQQSYQKISIILVDDGSTDGSGEICDAYAARDIRVQVIHQSNQGKLAARYNGARSLDCDYITFVDSDDWIDRDTYGKFAEYMGDGVDVISWRIIRYFSPSYQRASAHNFPAGFYDERRFHQEIYPYMIWSFDTNRFGVDPSLCNKLIKRELVLCSLKKAQEISIGYGDDVAVIYPLLRQISTLFLSDEALYYHRQREPQESAYYFRDDDFYGKLYSLYAYLRKCFDDEQGFIEQLDMFYANSTLYRLGLRKKYIQNKKIHIFPYDKVPMGKNIVLYGASTVGQCYYKQLCALEYANKILWVDKNHHLYENLRVRSVDALRNLSGYDYVVIAIADQTVASGVADWLARELEDREISIVWSIREMRE